MRQYSAVLVCSANCFISGHAYSVNIVEQCLMNSPSLKGFPFSAIDSTNLKHSFVISSESVPLVPDQEFHPTGTSA